MLFSLVGAEELDDIFVLKPTKQGYFLFEGVDFLLFLACVVTYFADWYLFDSNLTTLLKVDALVHIAERAVADHSA